MSKPLNLIGQKFGKWTVLERASNSPNGETRWLCQCECGTQRIVIGKTLKNGKSTSCGCNRGRKINLLNQRFGKLVVIKEAENKENGRTAWLCQCDCGQQKIVGTKELQNGDTQSCGCLRNEVVVKNEIGNRYGKLTVIAREYSIHEDGAYWVCQCDCGNQIITSGRRLRSGHTTSCGCIISKGEMLISSILTGLNINFSRQYTFKDCLTENGSPCKFDFAIFDNKNKNLICLIEYDGIQHFEKTNWDLERNILRDNIKNCYCAEHKIPLIRIPYTDFKIIDKQYLIERINKICTADILYK